MRSSHGPRRRRRRRRSGLRISAIGLGILAGLCWGEDDRSYYNYGNIDVLPSSNNETQRLHIASLFDLGSFPAWPKLLTTFTITLLNNHSDGWHDNLLADGAQLFSTIADSACDDENAIRAYMDLPEPPHAIFGCRCSGASMGVARLAAAEVVPMLSPTSSSVKLSNKKEYPTFSRLIAPDDDRGQVGALITLLRSFGWDRISIINTDIQYTKDIALELSDAWKGHHIGDDPFVGEVAYADTIKLNNSNSDQVDQASVRRVLNAVPAENPDVNSRVIVLFAHHQHAFPILKIANQMNFQPDTIWVGTSEWIGREPQNGDTSWMPPVPGYLGIRPYRNASAPVYQDYLHRLQDYERRYNLPVTDDLLTYDYIAERIVDGLVALAMALSQTPKDLRRDGYLVSQKLRELKFKGLSGPVAFDENGDRKDPRFTVFNLQSRGTKWTPIGFVTPNYGSIAEHAMCWAEVGCGIEVMTPDDSYPVEKDLVPFWIWIIVASLVLGSILLYRESLKNRTEIDKLHKIEQQLSTLDSHNDAAKQRKGKLYKEIAGLLGQPPPDHWTEEQGLVEVEPMQQEYWDVLSQLRATMNQGETCHLSKLSRVQNVGVWSYYVFRKNQLANKYRTDLNDAELLKEKEVWHGTSSLNPDVIYNDQQEGFMMQLSQQGQWGRGIYFSERSGYCDPYSFKPMTEHSNDFEEDRELFLVKLLIGEAVFLDRNEGEWMEEACKTLLTPPDNPGRNALKFDTVEGEIDDEAKTRIFVVYENGRAYPEYLVRYYKGERDETRTPYLSLEEALRDKLVKDQETDEVKDNATGGTANPDDEMHSDEEMQSAGMANPDDEMQLAGTANSDGGMHSDVIQAVSSVVSVQAGTTNADGTENPDDVMHSNQLLPVQAVWQFLNDTDEWENYLGDHQIQIEQAYQQDAAGIVTLEHFPWTYAIDFTVNMQTNLDHPDNKSRQVRRIILDSPV